MLIKAMINEKYPELELHVCKNLMDDEVKNMVTTLHDLLDQKLTAVDSNGNRVTLTPGEILSFYSEGQKVFAMDKNGRYAVTRKLYELEEELSEKGFIRISRSEIVNYRMIKSMDMSVTGTIRLTMKNGYATYTSRRNVKAIKEVLLKER